MSFNYLLQGAWKLYGFGRYQNYRSSVMDSKQACGRTYPATLLDHL